MKIALIFGGKSDEHEVSRKSARNVLNSLNSDKYDVLKIGITREGKWLLTQASPEDIENGDWEKEPDNKRTCFASDPVSRNLIIINDDNAATFEQIDCAIPMLHGDFGEDGTVQGLLEMSGIPYVGPGVKASANCMDKSVTKRIVAYTGIRQADYYTVYAYDYASDKAAEIDAVKAFIGGDYPVFVKPSSAGSSVGATKVTGEEDLAYAVELALAYDDKALVEEMIVGRELEVAVMGNSDPVTSGAVGEILTAGEFYTYDAKYNNPESKTRIADDLPPGVSEEIQEAALTIYKALECAGMSRVDFFYSESKGVVFNEINAIPGFTNISMYPQLWRMSGLSDEEIMDRLIGLAVSEYERKQ